MISIIIPCYNGEKYIDRLFNCFERQTSKNFEVILINDGSKDNSENIAKEKAKQCSFSSKIISVDNGGVSRARNIGIDNAQGDFLMFIDVDDMITDDRVEYVQHMFTSTDADIVLTEHNVVEDYSSNIMSTPPIIINNSTEYKLYNKNEILDTFLAEKIKTNVCGGGIRKKIITENGLRFIEGLKYCEDIHFMWQIFACCKKVCLSKKITYFYMYVSNSAMSKFDKDRLLGYEAIKSLSPFITEHTPHFSSRFDKYVPQRIMWSYMRQGSCHMSYKKWKVFFNDYPIRKMMCPLISYNKKIVAFVSLLYLIHPYFFYIACRLEGKRNIHK